MPLHVQHDRPSHKMSRTDLICKWHMAVLPLGVRVACVIQCVAYDVLLEPTPNLRGSEQQLMKPDLTFVGM